MSATSDDLLKDKFSFANMKVRSQYVTVQPYHCTLGSWVHCMRLHAGLRLLTLQVQRRMGSSTLSPQLFDAAVPAGLCAGAEKKKFDHIYTYTYTCTHTEANVSSAGISKAVVLKH